MMPYKIITVVRRLIFPKLRSSQYVLYCHDLQFPDLFHLLNCLYFYYKLSKGRNIYLLCL